MPYNDCVGSLGAEVALGEGSDESDFGEKADDDFAGDKDGEQVVQCDAAVRVATGDDAAPVEGGEAENERWTPGVGYALHCWCRQAPGSFLLPPRECCVP